jgi:hypothetical protein
MQKPTNSSVTTTLTTKGKEHSSSFVSPYFGGRLYLRDYDADGVLIYSVYFTDSCYQALAYWIMSISCFFKLSCAAHLIPL